jgi:hypothetical protein
VRPSGSWCLLDRWRVAVNSGSRSYVAAARRRIARRRLASATDLARYAGSRVASYFDKGEPIRGSARREEAREDLLARESLEFGHERA